MQTGELERQQDDQRTWHWIALLRDGTEDDRFLARNTLAAIFEERGLREEAIGLLIDNIQHDARDAATYRWLARLYREVGNEVFSARAAAQAMKHMPAAPTQPAERSVGPVAAVSPAPTGTTGAAAYCTPSTVAGQASAAYASPRSAPGAPHPAPPRPSRRRFLDPFFLTLTACLFIPPLGMAVVWLRRTPRLSSKLIATAFVAVWCVIWLGALSVPAPASPASSTGSSPAPRQTPAPTRPPSRAEALIYDPREIVAEPRAYTGRNIQFQGKALTVTFNQGGVGTWVQLMAQYLGGHGTESIIFEFPDRQSIWKGDCFRLYGVAAGTQRVTRTLTGASQDVPVFKGYASEALTESRDGQCY